ncbi:hypothetical protein JNUCC64_20545 [Streptomyces sp. JNUCC 64]
MGPTARTGLTALALALSLAATGCGGGSGERAAHPSGTPGASRAATAPTASAPVNTVRPDIVLPGDLTERYEGWVTGDSAKDLVLGDAGQAQGAVLDALVRGRATTGAVEFFFAGDALSAVRAYVRDGAATGTRPTGSVRYHDPELTMPVPDPDAPRKGFASLSFCADESGLLPRDRASGGTGAPPRGPEAHVRYDLRLRLSDRGVWRTHSLATERGEKTCAP